MRLPKVIFCIFLLCFGPTKVFAQPRPTNEEQARQLYEQAASFYNVQDYTKALELFKQAYFASNNAALLINIGQCHRYMQNYDDAIRAFKTYLQEDPDSSYRADLEKTIAELEAEKKRLAGTEKPTLTSLPVKEKDSASGVGRSLIYGGAAAGALGLGLGALAIPSRNEASSLARLNEGDAPDIDKIKADLRRAKTLEVLSTGLISVAALSIGIGILWPTLTHPTNPRLSATRDEVSFVVRF